MHVKPHLAFSFSLDWQKPTGLIAHPVGDAVDNRQYPALLMGVQSETCLREENVTVYNAVTYEFILDPSILLFWIWSKDNLGRI